MVTPGYFETFGIRIIKGRHFTEQDTAASARVAMVNETFASQYFSDVDPLTQRVVVGQLIPGSRKAARKSNGRLSASSITRAVAKGFVATTLL